MRSRPSSELARRTGRGVSGSAAVLARLRGGLIVSVQANADSVLNTPEAIALLSRCAAAAGAVAIRAEGEARLKAVRAAVNVPLIGLIKRRYPGFEPYITATLEDVRVVLAAGCEIVAFDATRRPRPDGAELAAAVREIHTHGALAMADCAELDDARAAHAAGVDIVASTLAGYTGATQGRSLPALDLVREMASLAPFVICEGGVGTPAQVAQALAAGAAAVVVGTAITNIDERVKLFAAAAARGT